MKRIAGVHYTTKWALCQTLLALSFFCEAVTLSTSLTSVEHLSLHVLTKKPTKTCAMSFGKP